MGPRLRRLPLGRCLVVDSSANELSTFLLPFYFTIVLVNNFPRHSANTLRVFLRLPLLRHSFNSVDNSWMIYVNSRMLGRSWITGAHDIWLRRTDFFFFDWYSFFPPAAARFSDSIIAIACFREVTFFPEPPDFKSPAFHLCMTSSQGTTSSPN